MKKLINLLTILFILGMSTLFTNEVRAETIITYDFSQYEIPEGQPTTLTVDSSTLEIMKSQPTYIAAFVDALSARYNTPSAIINKTVEITYLSNVINGISLGGNHIPTYISALSNTLVMDTVGTYVDVNITTQTLTVVSNGQPVLVTPIVTGNINKGHGTPTGNFSVQYKQRNRTLIGKNNSYRSFVRYWARFTSASVGIGLHDASWRANFGGDIYLTNGSHGCVNIPPSVMPTIYDSIAVGTPVNVHM